MAFDTHMRVETCHRLGGAFDLRTADIGGRMDHLALQVRERHRVVVDDTERADAGRRKIEQDRRAEPAGADHQDPRALERRLAGATDLAQHEMPRIALDLVAFEHGAIGRIHRKSRFDPHDITRSTPLVPSKRDAAPRNARRSLQLART